ncbi:hypothetical protein [Siccirubricoccus sp. G192]|uniref:hypothetical protein n=1 Tax=Siccirubricoccus sp. G192 TaxID=2849651 RepID=UPI001C2CA021|nr:hypothetical protein [Siccirubricoccus sp. G192]MBV1798002.1 hypothetical protein [Siccirubricoccus sp. G192]
MQAAARLEAAVERLAAALPAALARPRPAGQPGGDADSVPRAEVAALAARLDATILRLRAAMQDELRQADEPGEED